MSAAPLHQLISIPASHYCERARWALDLVGIPFVEYGWAPMLHYCGTIPVGGKSVPILVAPRGDAAAVAAAANAVADVDARKSGASMNNAAASASEGGGGAKAAKQRSPPKPGVLIDSADIVEYAHLRFLGATAAAAAAAAAPEATSAVAAVAAGNRESPLYPADPDQLKEVGGWARVLACQARAGQGMSVSGSGHGSNWSLVEHVWCQWCGA